MLLHGVARRDFARLKACTMLLDGGWCCLCSTGCISHVHHPCVCGLREALPAIVSRELNLMNHINKARNRVKNPKVRCTFWCMNNDTLKSIEIPATQIQQTRNYKHRMSALPINGNITSSIVFITHRLILKRLHKRVVAPASQIGYCNPLTNLDCLTIVSVVSGTLCNQQIHHNDLQPCAFAQCSRGCAASGRP